MLDRQHRRRQYQQKHNQRRLASSGTPSVKNPGHRRRTASISIIVTSTSTPVRSLGIVAMKRKHSVGRSSASEAKLGLDVHITRPRGKEEEEDDTLNRSLRSLRWLLQPIYAARKYQQQKQNA
ncbi:hypothetical protein HK102_005327, partial [Quaeritorhiza haematococci]